MSGTRGTASFVWSCKECKRESSAKFDPTPPKPYTADDSGQFAPLIVLDCRGLEFVGFDPRVSNSLRSLGVPTHELCRVYGDVKAQSRGRSLRRLILRKASGQITTRR